MQLKQKLTQRGVPREVLMQAMEEQEGPAIYLTEDCGARQTPVWTSPRAAALAVPVTEPLAAVLTAAGKWQISDIHITDLLDIRTESHYNAT